MSPSKWIEGVNAIGIVSKAGRYGGTYAHSEWIVFLRELAVKQMETLSMVSMDGIKQLPGGDSKRVTK